MLVVRGRAVLVWAVGAPHASHASRPRRERGVLLFLGAFVTSKMVCVFASPALCVGACAPESASFTAWRPSVFPPLSSSPPSRLQPPHFL